MIKEFCTQDPKLISKALLNGADRIELCSDLSVGGLTPTDKMLLQATKIAPNKVMAMIRPRANDFCYNQSEIEQMKSNIQQIKQKYPIQGVVFGCLTKDKQLDKKAILELLKYTQDLEVTFHMAFDELPSLNDQKLAIDFLAKHNVQRILTHGGPLSQDITQNLDTLKELIAYGKQQKIIVMPGGGITYQNYQIIASKTQAFELHGTKIVPIN